MDAILGRQTSLGDGGGDGGTLLYNGGLAVT